MILFNGCSSLNHHSGIDVNCEWARLRAFPIHTFNVDVETYGGPFARTFEVRFEAEPKAIQIWLQGSPGFWDAQEFIGRDGSKTYAIRPGGGANDARITISNDGRTVFIETNWS